MDPLVSAPRKARTAGRGPAHGVPGSAQRDAEVEGLDPQALAQVERMGVLAVRAGVELQARATQPRSPRP